jgi:hypothetical protein
MDKQDPCVSAGHEHAAHLLGASANLSGTCLAAAAVVGILSTGQGLATLADNILALSALCFLFSTVLGYATVRRRSRRLRVATEVAFALGGVLLMLVLLALALAIAI